MKVEMRDKLDSSRRKYLCDTAYIFPKRQCIRNASIPLIWQYICNAGINKLCETVALSKTKTFEDIR
jgi:hypothetical protein